MKEKMASGLSQSTAEGGMLKDSKDGWDDTDSLQLSEDERSSKSGTSGHLDSVMTTFTESGAELLTADLIYLTQEHCCWAYRTWSSKKKTGALLVVCGCLNKAGQDFCQCHSHCPVTTQ